MIKTILSTLILATVSLTASADYMIKMPLEAAQGGSLPDGSISFKSNNIVAPTIVSVSNVCIPGVSYNASTLYTTQKRVSTTSCSDITEYSDGTKLTGPETLTNENIVGTKYAHPYFLNDLKFSISSASVNYVNPGSFININNKAKISSSIHKTLFNSIYFIDMDKATSRYSLRINGNLMQFSNMVKSFKLTTSTGITRECNLIIAGDTKPLGWYFDSVLNRTEIRCFIDEILNPSVNLNSSANPALATTGTIEFILEE